jgi:hypothetical protein
MCKLVERIISPHQEKAKSAVPVRPAKSVSTKVYKYSTLTTSFMLTRLIKRLLLHKIYHPLTKTSYWRRQRQEHIH